MKVKYINTDFTTIKHTLSGGRRIWIKWWIIHNKTFGFPLSTLSSMLKWIVCNCGMNRLWLVVNISTACCPRVNSRYLQTPVRHFCLSGSTCSGAVMEKRNREHSVILNDFSDRSPSVDVMCKCSAALVSHVLHTAPCGVLQTEIRTWQWDPLFAPRLTHLYSHLFIGLFK